jgi:hypothetical protein
MSKGPILVRNCQECGKDCFCDGYIRDDKLMCRKCAESWDVMDGKKCDYNKEEA